jgi:hypothetical protein
MAKPGTTIPQFRADGYLPDGLYLASEAESHVSLWRIELAPSTTGPALATVDRIGS